MVIFQKDEYQLITDKAKITKRAGDSVSISGMLYLTNLRVIFESHTGFLSKKIQTEFDMPLRYIQNVGVEGFIGKRLVMETLYKKSPHAPSLTIEKWEFSVENPSGWETQIRAAVQDA